MYLRSLILAAAIIGPAHAADDLQDPKVEYESNALRGSITNTWAGAHVGVNFGVAHTSGGINLGQTAGDLIALDVQNGLFPRSESGHELAPVGGISAGYDMQYGNLVAGVGVSAYLTDIDGFFGQNKIDPNPQAPFTGVQTIIGAHTNINSYATANVRLGYSLGNTLIYGTAGLAVGKVENRFTLAIPELGYTSPDWSTEGTRYGYAVGGGVETKLSQNLSLRMEVEYVDLADSTVVATDPANFPGQRIDYKFDNSFTVGRIGLIYGF